MFVKVLRDFSRPHWVDIVRELKSSTGLSVSELSKRLNMSYMGVKQHCVDLEKKGYLDTWRRPKPVGRPEKVYRLTRKTEPLFPTVGVEFALDLLENVRATYGGTAPEKLIFGFFEKTGTRYAGKVKGNSIAERASSLARIRDAEGYRSECRFDVGNGLCIVEHHNLLEPIASAYPSVMRMEEAMIGRVLRTRVTREEEAAGEQSRVVFRIDALGRG